MCHIDQLCHLWTLLTFFCSVLCVNLQLSLSLISCKGLSISPLSLFLFLALSSPFCLRSVGTRWPLRLPPNKPPTLRFFLDALLPLLSFVPAFFWYPLQNASLRLSYFLPAGPSVLRRLSGQMFLPVSFPPSLCLSASPSISFMLTWKQWSAVVTSLCMRVSVST